MNFKLSELNEWYDTGSGKINSKIIIKSIKKISYINQNKTILYFGPEKIVKKIIDDSYNFNSFYISHSGNTDVKSELQRLPFKNSIIDNVLIPYKSIAVNLGLDLVKVNQIQLCAFGRFRNEVRD